MSIHIFVVLHVFYVISVEQCIDLITFRVDELQIQDIEFLYGCSNPTIIIIYQDTHGRHIRTHEISLKEKEFSKVIEKLFFSFFIPGIWQ